MPSDEQGDVRPVVGVAVVVVRLAPRLATVDAPQRVVDGAVGEEVARLVARLAVGRRHVAERVEEPPVAAAPPDRRRRREQRQAEAALQHQPNAQVGVRNPALDGTALMKEPACGCETEMKRTASRRELAWSSIWSFSQQLWWITDEYLRCAPCR